ncbi:MAG: hypothetical protein H6696_15920 [Deferribacteres bacterium]|nr:hypothetical protein [candidate division KSB1 bacterium]MCB9503418.1 hypothetical protein [Deferribacteres bacterium]
MLSRILFIVLIAFSFIFVSCSSNEEEKKENAKQVEETNDEENSISVQTKDGEMDLTDAMTQMQQMMSGGEKVEPINFRKLREMLPKEIDGIKGSNFKGEKTGGFGIKVSTASADYEEDDMSITVTITDMGTMKGMMAMASAAWLNAEIDRETDDEIEQTYTFNGNKTHKKYNSTNESGEINTIIANRFLINVEGRNVSFERMEAALAEVPTAKLESLKNEGIEQ